MKDWMRGSAMDLECNGRTRDMILSSKTAAFVTDLMCKWRSGWQQDDAQVMGDGAASDLGQKILKLWCRHHELCFLCR